MTSRVTLALVVLAVLTATASAAASFSDMFFAAYNASMSNYQGGNGGNGYDYYVFATEWAGTVCQHYHCGEAANIDRGFFNIHGLWPSQNNNDRAPFSCGGESFNAGKLSQDTNGQMERYWSGLYSSANVFHSHEWEKHGTCWENDGSRGNALESYFQRVLDLGKRYNAYNVLSGAGITPGGSYATQDVINAFSRSYGVSAFNLQCQSKQLLGINVCMDKNYNIINCPGGARNSCGSSFTYPSL